MFAFTKWQRKFREHFNLLFLFNPASRANKTLLWYKKFVKIRKISSIAIRRYPFTKCFKGTKIYYSLVPKIIGDNSAVRERDNKGAHGFTRTLWGSIRY